MKMSLFQTLSVSKGKLKKKEKENLIEELAKIGSGENQKNKDALLLLIIDYYKSTGEITSSSTRIPNSRMKGKDSVTIMKTPDDLLFILSKFVNLLDTN